MSDQPRYGPSLCSDCSHCTFLGPYVDPLTEKGYDLYVHEHPEVMSTVEYIAVNAIDPPPPGEGVENGRGYTPAEAILLRLHHPCREAYGRHLIRQQQRQSGAPLPDDQITTGG